MNLAWITDIHLNFAEPKVREKFYQSLSDYDAILLGGDVADAQDLTSTLAEMMHAINKPLYFVLGNHDYYRGSVTKVREEIIQLCENNAQLNWLPHSKAIQLSQEVVLVGEDCWADGRYGDYANSPVVLNDSRYIQELRQADNLLEAMQKLADADAARLTQHLEFAIEKHRPKRIIVLIHVPPFRENCMYEGKISNDDFLPFFASKVVGDLLFQIAKHHPEVDFLVLCGHTHSESFSQPLSNLTVKSGSAEYTKPKIQEVLVTTP